MGSCYSQWNYREGKQSRAGFELGSSIPFPTMLNAPGMVYVKINGSHFGGSFVFSSGNHLISF